MLKPGDRVTIPVADGEEGARVVGTFVKAAGGETSVLDGVSRDVVYVAIKEGEGAGTTVKVPFFWMRRAFD